MQVFMFSHDTRVKPGCCGWRTTTTYWMATTRDQAQHEIRHETPDDREPHGLCARCLATLLSTEDYTIEQAVKTS